MNDYIFLHLVLSHAWEEENLRCIWDIGRIET